MLDTVPTVIYLPTYLSSSRRGKSVTIGRFRRVWRGFLSIG
jgi:hypothetical protein